MNLLIRKRKATTMIKVLLEDIREKMEQAIADAKYRGETTACTTINTNDGYIDVWCDNKGDSEVVISQDMSHDREHPLLEDCIHSSIPEWEDVEIEEEDIPSDWVRYYGRI